MTASYKAMKANRTLFEVLTDDSEENKEEAE